MIADINSELLACYRDTRLQRVRPATVKHELGIILRALKFAVNEKGIYLPSFPKITFPQVRNARNRRVSDDEIEMLTSMFNKCLSFTALEFLRVYLPHIN